MSSRDFANFGAGLMEHVPQLVLVAVIVGVIWILSRPRVVFVLRIRDGIPVVVRGRVRDALLRAVEDICRENGITSGTVTALPCGRRARLKCSAEIPAACQQQLRNVLLSEWR